MKELALATVYITFVVALFKATQFAITAILSVGGVV